MWISSREATLQRLSYFPLIFDLDLPVVDISALHVVLTFDPALYIDITHLLPSEEGIIFQHHIIRVPDDASQLIAVTQK